MLLDTRVQSGHTETDPVWTGTSAHMHAPRASRAWHTPARAAPTWCASRSACCEKPVAPCHPPCTPARSQCASFLHARQYEERLTPLLRKQAMAEGSLLAHCMLRIRQWQWQGGTAAHSQVCKCCCSSSSSVEHSLQIQTACTCKLCFTPVEAAAILAPPACAAEHHVPGCRTCQTNL